MFECPRPAPPTPIPLCQGDYDVDPEGPRVLCDSDGDPCVGLHSDCVAPEVTGGTAAVRGRPWHPGTNIPVCSSECTGASHEVQTAGDFIVISTQTSPSILLLHQVEVLKGILQILMGGRERHTPDRVTVECWILQGHVGCEHRHCVPPHPPQSTLAHIWCGSATQPQCSPTTTQAQRHIPCLIAIVGSNVPL